MSAGSRRSGCSSGTSDGTSELAYDDISPETHDRIREKLSSRATSRGSGVSSRQLFAAAICSDGPRSVVVAEGPDRVYWLEH